MITYNRLVELHGQHCIENVPNTSTPPRLPYCTKFLTLFLKWLITLKKSKYFMFLNKSK